MYAESEELLREAVDVWLEGESEEEASTESTPRAGTDWSAEAGEAREACEAREA